MLAFERTLKQRFVSYRGYDMASMTTSGSSGTVLQCVCLPE